MKHLTSRSKSPLVQRILSRIPHVQDPTASPNIQLNRKISFLQRMGNATTKHAHTPLRNIQPPPMRRANEAKAATIELKRNLNLTTLDPRINKEEKRGERTPVTHQITTQNMDPYVTLGQETEIKNEADGGNIFSQSGLEQIKNVASQTYLKVPMERLQRAVSTHRMQPRPPRKTSSQRSQLRRFNKTMSKQFLKNQYLLSKSTIFHQDLMQPPTPNTYFIDPSESKFSQSGVDIGVQSARPTAEEIFREENPKTQIPHSVNQFLSQVQNGEGPRLMHREFGYLEDDNETTIQRKLFGGTTTDESNVTEKKSTKLPLVSQKGVRGGRKEKKEVIEPYTIELESDRNTLMCTKTAYMNQLKEIKQMRESRQVAGVTQFVKKYIRKSISGTILTKPSLKKQEEDNSPTRKKFEVRKMEVFDTSPVRRSATTSEDEIYDSYTRNERNFKKQQGKQRRVKTNTRAKSVLDVSKLSASHFINEAEEEMYSPHFLSMAEESDNTEVEMKYEKKKNIRKTERLVLDFQKQLKDKFSVYLKECEKSGIFPADCGLTHRRNLSSKRYDIRNYEIGDDYACALSKVIAKLTHLEVLNLCRNRLTEKGCLAVLRSLNPTSLIELDLSQNKLRPASCRLLASNFLNPETSRGAVLQRLSLETNPIGNIGCQFIVDAVLMNSRLKVLNLSRCNISDVGATHIAQMLTYNQTLVSLLLHWNDIRARGGAQIFQALIENESLQILDISYNSLKEKPSLSNNESSPRNTGFSGHQPPPIKIYKLAQKLKKCFSENRTLLHLDLTFCNLSQEEVKIMNEGLQENHSILGLHLFGNSQYLTDARGFVQKKKESPINSHILCRISDDLDTGSSKKLVASNNCWICEGWTLVKFTFVPQVSSADYLEEGEPVYLNLEFEEFQPDPLHYDAEEEVYELTRMVPPGPLHYYFTIRGRRVVAKGQNRDYYKGHHSQAISKRKLFQAIPEISNYTSKNTHRASMFSSLREPPSPDSSPIYSRSASRQGSQAILMNVIPPENQSPKPSKFRMMSSPQPSGLNQNDYASRMSDLKSRKSLVDRYSQFDEILSGKEAHSSDESVQSQRMEGVSISRAHKSAHKAEYVVDIASTVLKVPLTNCIENVIQCKKPIVSYFDAVSEAKVYPRTLNRIEWKKKVKKVDPEWEFGKSIFKNLKYDGADRMGSYYDRDINMARIGKLVGKIMPKGAKKKDIEKEIAEVQDYLKQNYSLIVETFKHFGCLQPSGEVVSIGLNALTEMIFQMNVLDGKYLRFADIDLDFYAANFLDPSFQLGKVPEKQLV